MNLNREKITELMKINFGGSYTKFARELDVDPSHIHRYLNKGVGGGKMIFSAIMKYCKQNGLDFEEYIDF